MRRVRIGVVGIGRGWQMMDYCKNSTNAELVAICDKWEEGLLECKQKMNDPSISYYTSFDEFLKDDRIEAVVLANYANEHAPFAVRCLDAGKHVFSEVLPCQTLAEAVELVEATERNPKLVYCYGENYCYMPAPREMRRLYREGVFGEFEYGEGEYMHNCESIWADITYGDPDHWRNHFYANFYCTHSLGPIIHITGLKPVSVTGFETPFNARAARCGALTGGMGMEIVTLENGAIVKSIHSSTCSRCSIWYSVYGTKGNAESIREISGTSVHRIFVDTDDYKGEFGEGYKSYEPKDLIPEKQGHYGHGGSDFYTMYNFVEKILGNDTDVIGVYEGLDMFLPGLLAYRSVLNGGAPVKIPDFRFQADRERFRYDRACTDPKVAGDQLIPSYSKGNPVVPQSTYDRLKEEWLRSRENKDQ